MTLEEYWAKIVARNPALVQGRKVRMDAETVKSLVEQAYREGAKSIGAKVGTHPLLRAWGAKI